MDEEYLRGLLPIDGGVIKTSIGIWLAKIVSVREQAGSTVITYIIDFSLQPDDATVRRLDLRVPAEMLDVEKRFDEVIKVIGVWLEDENANSVIRV